MEKILVLDKCALLHNLNILQEWSQQIIKGQPRCQETPYRVWFTQTIDPLQQEISDLQNSLRVRGL